MDVIALIRKYYPPGSLSFELLIEHSTLVMEKALTIARGISCLNPDFTFIREAAMLHDIGILYTHEPRIGCHGDKPYLCHGYLGRKLLEKEGLPRHALVCERHIGTGLSIRDIETQNLPLAKRDMLPQSLEEQIICYADKFFSKRPGRLKMEKPVSVIRKELVKFGIEKVQSFDKLHDFFNKTPPQEKAPEQGQ